MNLYPQAISKFKSYDSDRLRRQAKCVSRWFKAGGSGVVEGVTGFGKTTVAWLAIINLAKRLERKPKVKIITPTNVLKQSWLEEANELGINVSVDVMQSAYTVGDNCDLLVVDEIHNLGSESFSEIFKNHRYKFLLGLTPHLKRLDGKESRILKHAKIVDKVSIQEALANGWINEYLVYNVRLSYNDDLSSRDKSNLDDIQVSMDRSFSWFEHDLSLVTKFGKSAKFRREYANHMGSSVRELETYAANFWRQVRKRKRILLSNPVKLERTATLLEHFGERKIIVFLNTKKEIRKLMATYNVDAEEYYSSMPQHRKDRIIEDFKKGKLSRLYTVRALDEGFSDKAIDMGIEVAGNSNPKQFIQRLGRIVRASEGKKQSIFICLYYPGTQEEKWLRNKQRLIPKSHIKEIDFETFINQNQH